MEIVDEESSVDTLAQHRPQFFAVACGTFVNQPVVYGGIGALEGIHHPPYLFRAVQDVVEYDEKLFQYICSSGAYGGLLSADLLEIADHGLMEQSLLVAEQVVKRPFRNAQLLRDVVHTHRFESSGDEHL